MKDLIFMSVQPDVPYFHWQVEVMITNFTKLGINPNNIEVIYALEKGKGISNGGRLLTQKYPFVRFFFYDKTVENNHGYIPILRLDCLEQHFIKYNEGLKDKNIFYHDSDIIFRKLPDFDSLLKDNVWYLSDTVSYIGYDYIVSKSFDLLEKMCEIVNISTETVEANQSNSGGAQYLIKGVDHVFWHKVKEDCLELYKFMTEREKEERKTLSNAEANKYNPIQKWCSDMWAVLWNAWYFGKNTKLSDELSFSWATSRIEEYEKHNIFHNAGVTGDRSKELFYKGNFINQTPFEADLSFVSDKFASIKYVEAIKSVKI